MVSTGEPSIGVRDILKFSMLINLLLLLLLLPSSGARRIAVRVHAERLALTRRRREQA
jgi:hypothetical protein